MTQLDNAARATEPDEEWAPFDPRRETLAVPPWVAVCAGLVIGALLAVARYGPRRLPSM
jgi:hypothetical protein